ncbi:hypothetical protein SAMN05443247_07910 [Bradyrhizobium erythrophlei]|nr:hypothetical protein SAMN05443247_07910 [Bradyrhizobium erythrophlei]
MGGTEAARPLALPALVTLAWSSDLFVLARAALEGAVRHAFFEVILRRRLRHPRLARGIADAAIRSTARRSGGAVLPWHRSRLRHLGQLVNRAP